MPRKTSGCWICHSYVGSHGVYGVRRVFGDLREAGERCGLHRVERLVSRHNQGDPWLQVATSDRRTPIADRSQPSAARVTVDAANEVWVTDITYIRTWQGWLYLAVVVDLYARNVVGKVDEADPEQELALDDLLMAVWRRQPNDRVIVHSDQGSQYGSDDFKRFCVAHNLEPSMSRRDNCWDKCRRRVLLQQLEEGTHPQAHLQDPRVGACRRLRLHRSVLQPDPPPQPSGRKQSQGVRTRRGVRLAFV